MTNSRLSLHEIWRLGCLDETLDSDDQVRFAAMARSRFHTFLMGTDHARRQGKGDHEAGLIKGLAVELRDAPGLKKLWLASDTAATGIGEQVALQLEKLSATSH